MKKTNPISTKEIKKIASNFRKKYNVELNEHFPIYEILIELENQGLFTIQVMENDNPMFGIDVLALYNAYDNFIYIKESVLEDYDNNEYRANFTLAHELFHFLQHKVLKFEFCDTDECKTYCDPEWQANEFAGQLLIPEDYIDLEVNELVQMYHVSDVCAATRKLKIKKRNYTKYTNLK